MLDMSDLEVSKYDKLMIIGLVIKAVTGVLGASLILAEHRPYLTLAILAVGAATNEVISYLKAKHLKEKK